MQPVEQLLSRKSHPKLAAPAPSSEQLDILFKAALRAPDHAMLRPWRFRVYQGESLAQLGEKMLAAKLKADPEMTQALQDKLRSKPMRAPMVVVASVVIQSHPKVPEIEQWLSGGASVQNLLNAAHFLGIGAMWRTGGMAFNRDLMDSLGFAENEQMTGFIYLGTEVGEKRPVPEHLVAEYVEFNN